MLDPAPPAPQEAETGWFRKNRDLWIDLSLVLLLAALVAWSNLSWAALDHGPPLSDASSHAYQSLLFHDTLRTVPTPGQAFYQFFAFRNHYPLLAYQVGELGWLVLGRSPLAPVLGMVPFLGILAVSMYGLVRMMAGRLAGLTAAVMACTAPVVLDYARMPFLDMQLAAMVALGTWTLLASRSWEDLRWTRGFGVALGLGILTKWTFPAFVAVPLAAAAVVALRGRRPGDLRRALQMVAVAVVLALVGATFFPVQDLRPDQGPALLQLFLWSLALVAAVLQVARLRRDLPSPSALVNGAEALVLAVALAAPYYASNRDLVVYKAIYQAGVQVDYLGALKINLHDQYLWLYLGSLWFPLGAALGIVRPQTRSWTLQLLGSLLVNTLVASKLPPDPRYLLPNLVALLPVGLNCLRGSRMAGALALAAAVALGSFQAGAHLLDLGPSWPTLSQLRDLQYLSLRPPVRPPLPLRPREGPSPFFELMDAMRWNEDGDWTGALMANSQSESAVLQPRSLLYYAALKERELWIREVLLHGPEGEAFKERARTRNYLVMYPDPDLTMEEQDQRPRIPGEPGNREELIALAIQKGAFPTNLETLRVFHFGRSTLVELMVRKDDGPPPPREREGSPQEGPPPPP